MGLNPFTSQQQGLNSNQIRVSNHCPITKKTSSKVTKVYHWRMQALLLKYCLQIIEAFSHCPQRTPRTVDANLKPQHSISKTRMYKYLQTLQQHATTIVNMSRGYTSSPLRFSPDHFPINSITIWIEAIGCNVVKLRQQSFWDSLSFPAQLLQLDLPKPEMTLLWGWCMVRYCLFCKLCIKNSLITLRFSWCITFPPLPS